MTIRECVSCHSPDLVRWGQPFLRCRECGVVFRRLMPTEEDLLNMYARCYSEENIFRENTHMASRGVALKSHAEFVDSLGTSNMTVLDYGAGTGQFVHMLGQRGHHAEGCELSADARRQCKKEHGFDLHPSLDDLSESAYDVITAIEVAEHLPAPGPVFERMHALLKPGGVVYVTTPNSNGALARIKRDRWREAVKPFHLVLFNYVALRKTLIDAGFDTID